MNKTVYITFLFFFLLFLQVFILNNVLFLGYVNPYLYIAFVFLHPFRKNRFSFLLVSFLLGLCVDFFTDFGGIHAFSILFIAYIRLFVFRLIFKKNETDYSLFNLRLESFGIFFKYTIILTVIHHFILFSFANFSINNFTSVLTNTLFSSIFTLILFFLGMYIFSKK